MQNKSKLCFSTLGCSDDTLDEIFALCKKFGVGNIEIRGICGELNNCKISDFSPEKVAATAEKFKKAGIKPAVLGTSCEFHKEEKFDAAVAEGKASIEIAAKLGAKGIRVFGNRFGDDREKSTERVILGIKTLCDYAKDRGVDVLLETHGDFNTVEAFSPIVDALADEPRFGIIWDIEHTDSAKYAEFYEFAKPFIRHVHIKDSNEKGLTLVGEGNLPIKPIVEMMTDGSYDGLFSLEWEKKWHPELPDIEIALEKFVGIFDGIL